MARGNSKTWKPTIKAGTIEPGPQFWNPWPDQGARGRAIVPTRGTRDAVYRPGQINPGEQRGQVNVTKRYAKAGRPL